MHPAYRDHRMRTKRDAQEHLVGVERLVERSSNARGSSGAAASKGGKGGFGRCLKSVGRSVWSCVKEVRGGQGERCSVGCCVGLGGGKGHAYKPPLAYKTGPVSSRGIL